MAYTTQANATAPVLGRITQIFDTLMERRAQNRVYRQTISELGALSNRDLSDLGISRGEIKSIAFEAAYK